MGFGSSKEGRSSFSEEKEAKRLLFLCSPDQRPRMSGEEFFGSFFKKEHLPS
ncbi:MAG: hypothetical protein IT555_06860 [Acetobacteraceae bacterium]|nr:hypothetical protein [Acetobacteraceae bacterium]